jgi:hypothetical protein
MVDLTADITGMLGVGLTGAVAATAIGAASKVMYKAADEEAKMLNKRKARSKIRKMKIRMKIKKLKKKK